MSDLELTQEWVLDIWEDSGGVEGSWTVVRFVLTLLYGVTQKCLERVLNRKLKTVRVFDRAFPFVLK